MTDTAPPPTSTPAPAKTIDIGIVGGGIAGLTLARLLAKHRPALRTTIFDSGETAADAGKSIAINAAAAKTLDELGALPPDAVPIRRMRVAFADAPGGTVLGDDAENALGYAVSLLEMRDSLAAGLAMRRGKVASVVAMNDADDASMAITLADGEQWRCRLLVIACAVPPALLPPPFKVRTWNYCQAILSLTADAPDFPPHFALECFSPDGVVAFVPRTDGALGIILCAPTAVANRLNALSDAALAARLQQYCEHALVLRERRYAYPPHLSRTAPLASDAVALIGQGATTLHPIGAQNLSLGIADAMALAEDIDKHDTTAAALQHYHRKRITVHRQTAAVTSALALGVHCRALPFRIAGSLAAAPIKKRLAFLHQPPRPQRG